jgi:hypothetical protein
MSLKTFLMKKMLKSKMGDIPEDQQNKIFEAVEKNPELFKKIAEEIQAKVKSGKNQVTAAMEVMQKHQDELKKVIN